MAKTEKKASQNKSTSKKVTTAKKSNTKSAKKAPAKKAAPKKTVKKNTPKKQAVRKPKKGVSELLAELIVHGMQEKKAENIVVMDLRNVSNSVTDFFVICQAESTTQVAAIADSIWEEVRKATGEKPWHSEGFDNAQWILLDYVNVVAHVFQPEARYFYNIEKLWGDAVFNYINN